MLKRDGSYKYVRRCSFIAIAGAGAREGTPVKMRVDRVRRYATAGTQWEDIPDGLHVQGYMTAVGCYAVLAGDIRLV